MIHPRWLLVPILLPLGGCRFDVFSHHGIEVDGVRLTEHHQETLPLARWPESGLAIAAHQGDVEVVHHAGPTEIEVQVYERAPGRAHAALVDGRLVVHASEGKCAIGNVIVRTEELALDLKVTTGLGDVLVRGVALTGDASLATGMGDVEVHEAGSPRALVLETGMGDIHVSRLEGADLRASSGMGDLVVEDFGGPTGEFSTGMGDVELRRCTITRVVAETGMGDVVARESQFAERDLSSGLGSVSVR